MIMQADIWTLLLKGAADHGTTIIILLMILFAIYKTGHKAGAVIAAGLKWGADKLLELAGKALDDYKAEKAEERAEMQALRKDIAARVDVNEKGRIKLETEFTAFKEWLSGIAPNMSRLAEFMNQAEHDRRRIDRNEKDIAELKGNTDRDIQKIKSHLKL